MQPSNPYEYRAPHLVSQTHYCVMGDVTVADGVMVAPGVVLQAAAGSRIVIEAGACLAGGVCIQSRSGVLTIGAGANLGANVLVIGKGSVGAGACVSPGSTLMNPDVGADALLPPGSLVSTQPTSGAQSSASSSPHSSQTSGTSGYRSGYYSESRAEKTSGFTSGSYVTNVSSFTAGYTSVSSSQAESTFTQSHVTNPQQNDTFVNTFVEPPPVGPKAIETPSLSDQNGQYIDPSAQRSAQNNGQSNNVQSSSALTTQNTHRVYGKDQVSQLISTLFPNRQA